MRARSAKARILLALLAAVLVAPLPAEAKTAKKRRSWTIGEPIQIPGKDQCAALPEAGPVPWKPGERLHYDIDVLGANAGKLVLVALPPVGKGRSAEYPLRALAASNSFFSKIRRVRGRATSYVRAKDLHPRRYREDTNEGGVVKWAEAVFKKPSEGGIVGVQWQRNKVKGKRNLRYLNEIFDPVSANYYLRTLDLKEGQKVCFDAYAIRHVWRTFGSVKGLETVTVPAGTYQAWHIVGTAVRIDNARQHREMHFWISADEKRLPLASLGIIDLGPVRAQLTRADTSKGDDTEDQLAAEASGKAAKAGPKVAEDEDDAEGAD